MNDTPRYDGTHAKKGSPIRALGQEIKRYRSQLFFFWVAYDCQGAGFLKCQLEPVISILIPDPLSLKRSVQSPIWF
ncbi:hypothetical protein Cflav_PD3665 [Pedosphaera parvula Ellin514]|uniref:Uncharacterized protein n=1 Tax=Pedosphaera parvula (strain Ellin514) TaxID=320771 RepID=B9XHH2_PEDPL|nr:hypothetical protein Cflav_PD3665 [Pedosphaera parvula Ellin514]